MFVFNVSIKKSKIYLYILLVVILLIIGCFVIKSINKSTNKNTVNDSMETITYEINPESYSTVLKDCYANLDDYVGRKIKFSGFIYRLYDFQPNQFVLGREMIVAKLSNGKAQAVVIGFLCSSDNAQSFADGDWVEIEGTITKGYYHSELPVVEVNSIEKTNCPENPYVYPPDKIKEI